MAGKISKAQRNSGQDQVPEVSICVPQRSPRSIVYCDDDDHGDDNTSASDISCSRMKQGSF